LNSSWIGPPQAGRYDGKDTSGGNAALVCQRVEDAFYRNAIKRSYRLSVMFANCPCVSHDSCLFHGICES